MLRLFWLAFIYLCNHDDNTNDDTQQHHLSFISVKSFIATARKELSTHAKHVGFRKATIATKVLRVE
jgi:hypothetical protein